MEVDMCTFPITPDRSDNEKQGGSWSRIEKSIVEP
jgi:hypothetical protein